MKTTKQMLHQISLLIVLVALIIGGCNQSKQIEEADVVLQLSVIDSLLGSEYVVEPCQKSFRPPIQFQSASDSILELIRYNMHLNAETEKTLTLNNCFLDQDNHAGLLVTIVNGLTLQSDTAEFMAEYRQSFYDLFGWTNVNEKDLWVEDIFIKSFTIADSQTVHLKLLCLSQTGSALELNYFCPLDLYPHLSKRFESSAASIKSTL